MYVRSVANARRKPYVLLFQEHSKKCPIWASGYLHLNQHRKVPLSPSSCVEHSYIFWLRYIILCLSIFIQ